MIVQEFKYEWPPGSRKIEFRHWLKTLTVEEQNEYWQGRANGDRLRQIAIDEGRLKLEQDSYVWKDQPAFEKFKENDPIWEKYWRRWQEETGVKFIVTVKERDNE